MIDASGISVSGSTARGNTAVRQAATGTALGLSTLSGVPNVIHWMRSAERGRGSIGAILGYAHSLAADMGGSASIGALDGKVVGVRATTGGEVAVSGAMRASYSAFADLSGVTDLRAKASVRTHLSANISGRAHLVAPLATIVTASGTVLCVGTMAHGIVRRTRNVSGSCHASGALLGQWVRTGLYSGVVDGSSTLSFQQYLEGSGVVVCTGTLSGTPVRAYAMRGRVFAPGVLKVWMPRTIYGQGTLVGLMLVEQIEPPLDHRTCTKTFRYGQPLQRGDLAVYFSNLCVIVGSSPNVDRGRCPISPFSVTYTLYQVVYGDVQQQSGPADRMPVRGGVGEFYVPWTAGDGGQPGAWVIKWRYQVYAGSPIIEVPMAFLVFDAVLAHESFPGRVCKFGWD